MTLGSRGGAGHAWILPIAVRDPLLVEQHVCLLRVLFIEAIFKLHNTRVVALVPCLVRGAHGAVVVAFLRLLTLVDHEGVEAVDFQVLQAPLLFAFPLLILFLPIVLAPLSLPALVDDILVNRLGLEVLDGEARRELDGILNLPALVVEALQVNDEDPGRLLYGKALLRIPLHMPAGRTLVLVLAKKVL